MRGRRDPGRRSGRGCRGRPPGSRCERLVGGSARGSRRRMAAVALGAAGSGLVGAYDDLYGAPRPRASAATSARCASGTVTSGMIKIAGVGASAARRGADARRGATVGRRPHASTSVSTPALIAGTANLVNLFDLRPGRAAKVVCCSAPLVGRRRRRRCSARRRACLPSDLGGAVDARRLRGQRAGRRRWRRSAADAAPARAGARPGRRSPA